MTMIQTKLLVLPRHWPGVLLATLLASLLGACNTTSPSTYYMLTASGTRTPSGSMPSLGIGPIEVPQYLNRNGIVYGTDNNQLVISSYERWAEPLSDGIERVLGFNLALAMDTQSLQTYPWARGQGPDYGVQVNVLSMDANESEASLVAEWRIRAPTDKRMVSHRISRLTTPISASAFSAAAIASAYSELLRLLSEDIAVAIRADMERPGQQAAGGLR
jgi:uncharacterized lipoprotein YmbA